MPRRTPDPNEPTQPLGPEPGRTTDPMPPSPYNGGYVPAPPPPPPSGPLGLPPAAYGGPVVGAPPARPANRGGSFLGGILAAVIVVALLGVGLVALTQHPTTKAASSVAQVGNTPPAATAAPGTTPAPTDTAVPTAPPTFTPTSVPPTVAPSPNPRTLPPPPPGFANFLPQGHDWGLNYRIGTQVHAQTGALPVNGQNVNAIIFDLGHSASFTVYDLTQPIPSDQAQPLFDALTAALHAQDVQILDQGPATLGANVWLAIHLRGTIDGQRYEGYCLYTTHGTGANAVTLLAPLDTFAAINTSDFKPMIDSFIYLT